MSHDTHQHHPKENKTIISFKNSFWLVVIIVGLFVASLSFIKVESEGGEEGKGEAKETTEMQSPAGNEAGKGEAKTEEAHPVAAPADTTHKSEK
jgi:hypothetical protein